MANFNFNKVILGGRLCADPELKTTQSGISVSSVRIAVSRRKGKDEAEAQADFIDIVAWRQTAEFLCRYFRKGSSICVEGQIQTRSWTDQSGAKRYTVEVLADALYFVDSKADAAPAQPVMNGLPSAPPAPKPPVQQTFSTMPQIDPSYEQLDPGDDLPF